MCVQYILHGHSCILTSKLDAHTHTHTQLSDSQHQGPPPPPPKQQGGTPKRTFLRKGEGIARFGMKKFRIKRKENPPQTQVHVEKQPAQQTAASDNIKEPTQKPACVRKVAKSHHISQANNLEDPIYSSMESLSQVYTLSPMHKAYTQSSLMHTCI